MKILKAVLAEVNIAPATKAKILREVARLTKNANELAWKKAHPTAVARIKARCARKAA